MNSQSECPEFQYFYAATAVDITILLALVARLNAIGALCVPKT